MPFSLKTFTATKPTQIMSSTYYHDRNDTVTSVSMPFSITKFTNILYMRNIVYNQPLYSDDDTLL